jgi:AcrR family transcriptional regulator
MDSKRPQQERSRFTFSSILEATMQVLNRSGEKGLTTRGIAERAGVSIGSLYQYFKGADSILGEVLKERMRKDVEETWKQFEESRGQDLETRLHRTYLKIFETHLPLGKARTVLFQRAPSLKLVEFAKNEVEGLARRMFAELKQDGMLRSDLNDELALYLVTRAVFGVTMTVTIEHDQMKGSADELARELARLVGSYVGVRKP